MFFKIFAIFLTSSIFFERTNTQNFNHGDIGSPLDSLGSETGSAKPFEFRFDFLKPTKIQLSNFQPINVTKSNNLEDRSDNNGSSSLDIHSTLIQTVNHLENPVTISTENQDPVEFQDNPVEFPDNPVQQESLLDVYVRKCCGEGEAFILSLGSCSKYQTDFIVPTYVTSRRHYVNLTVDQMILHEGLLTTCSPSILEEDEFYLFDTGDLFAIDLDKFFRPGHYCLEIMVDDSHVPVSRLTAAYCPYSESMPTFDQNKIPVRKCCPQGELVTSETSECSHRADITTVEWTVPVEGDHYVSSLSTNFTDVYEVVAGYPECVKDERGESMESFWNFHILERNGYLYVPSLGFATPNYCIDEIHGTQEEHSAFAYVCLSTTEHRKFTQFNPSCQSESEFCVQKCCPAGQILNEIGHCITDPLFHLVPQSVPIFYPNGTILHLQNIDYNFGLPLCGSRSIFSTEEEERAEILLDGSLRYISYDPIECDPQIAQIIPPPDYCYEKILFSEYNDRNDIGPKIIPGALICYPNNGLHESVYAKQVDYIYSIFLGISDIFIFISIIIYLTVPDQAKRGLNKNIKLGHSILGRILLSFLFSLFFTYLFLIISKTASESINIASPAACTTLGVAMYICILATFFWMNVLCFELWWKCARQESTSGRRWFWYQLYGWGNPIFLGSIVLFIEFSPSIGSCFVKPNFGVKSCFFSETKTFGSAAKWIYLNGPVSVLLITDLIFFLLTVKSLLQTVQQSHKSTVKRQARQRLKLCFKLFLVMGICWLTEIISVAANLRTWYLAEIFNCLQGFVIFLIFILKPKIMEAVREKLCLVCCNKQPIQQPMRGRLTFTSSVLSDFLSSTKRSSSLSFSTASSSLSWPSSLHGSPVSSLPRKSVPVNLVRPKLRI